MSRLGDGEARCLGRIDEGGGPVTRGRSGMMGNIARVEGDASQVSGHGERYVFFNRPARTVYGGDRGLFKEARVSR